MMLEWVHHYHGLGLHPIPCEPGGKRPLIEWRPYQERQPTIEELVAWWTEWPDANVALVVGRGTVVADLDGPHAGQLLAEAGLELPADAPRVKTGNGKHVYLRLPPGVTARNRAAFLSSGLDNGQKSQVDLRADGGYVLAPPSLHPNGTRYEWLIPLVSLEAIPLVPDSFLKFRMESKPDEPFDGPDWVTRALKGVPEGLRDDTCARLAGYFLAKGHQADVVIAVLESFAQQCVPPLPAADVRRVVASIGRAEAQKAAPDSPEAVWIEHISISLAKALDEIQYPKSGVATPFLGLDNMITGGFQPGELIYLGARPGIGKTALGLEMARAAAKGGRSVLIVSREMLAAALARRMLAQEGPLSASELKLGTVDMDEVCAVAARLSGLPIWITDSARSLAEVRQAVESVGGGIHFLIVDYLQLVTAPKEIRDRRLQVEHVSQGLKTLAMDCQVPVLCLSSLSRPPTGTNPEPTLASLRESGELEHDADIVMFLHRKDDQTLCIVSKNRDGVTGTMRLAFRPEFVSFKEFASEQ
jgi:hypothetical protein